MTNPESVPIRPEIDAFLKEHRRTFFITIRKDGTPTIHPMTGLYHEGRLRYSSYKTSAKNRNIERDDRVCSLVLNGYDEPDFRASSSISTSPLPPSFRGVLCTHSTSPFSRRISMFSPSGAEP